MPAKKSVFPNKLSKEDFKAEFKKAEAKANSKPVQPVRAKKDADPTTRMQTRPLREPYKGRQMCDLPADWQDKFLEELSMRPIASRAARLAGVSRRTAYTYREADPEFKAAWDDAVSEGKDRHLEVLQEMAEMGNIAAAIYLAKEWNFNEAEKGKDEEQKEVKVGW